MLPTAASAPEHRDDKSGPHIRRIGLYAHTKRPVSPEEKAVAAIWNGRDSHFDRDAVDAFFGALRRIHAIPAQTTDEDNPADTGSFAVQASRAEPA